MEVAAPEPSAAPPSRTEAVTDAPAPTWTAIYARYLGPGTAGGCARARACHASVMIDAASAYEWLAQRGYIAGVQSAIVGSNSCLRGFGGNMPPRGPLDAGAIRDLEAWVAAGAANN